MNNKLPKVFQNNIGNVQNNVKVYHEGRTTEVFDNVDVNDVIDNLFNSPNHVYKTSVMVKTKKGVFNYDVVGRTRDSLITIDNQKIQISDIESIKIKGL